jgi:hypothetical protein
MLRRTTSQALASRSRARALVWPELPSPKIKLCCNSRRGRLCELRTVADTVHQHRGVLIGHEVAALAVFFLRT